MSAAETDIAAEVSASIKRWQKRRGSMVMMLHAIQERSGYVPREYALELARQTGNPLARIYEVLTFYNYFKLKSPGKVVVSVCTGTACHLKGASELVASFSESLKIAEGETDEAGDFHLQSVRCVGCCGLAPAVVINGKTYGKLKTTQVSGIVARWREKLAEEEEHPEKKGAPVHV